MDAGVIWTTPPSVLAKNTGDYAKRLHAAVVQLAGYFAARMEEYAKALLPGKTGPATPGKGWSPASFRRRRRWRSCWVARRLRHLARGGAPSPVRHHPGRPSSSSSRRSKPRCNGW